jgi:hypothetical protein
MIKDILAELGEPVVSLALQNRITDADGSSADLKGARRALVLAAVGDSGDTLSGTVKIELEVEESDDNSVFTDVADSDLGEYVNGTNDGCFALIDQPTEDSKLFVTEYKGSKRYVRVVANFTGSHPVGTVVGSYIIPFARGQKPGLSPSASASPSLSPSASTSPSSSLSPSASASPSRSPSVSASASVSPSASASRSASASVSPSHSVSPSSSASPSS